MNNADLRELVRDMLLCSLKSIATLPLAIPIVVYALENSLSQGREHCMIGALDLRFAEHWQPNQYGELVFE